MRTLTMLVASVIVLCGCGGKKKVDDGSGSGSAGSGSAIDVGSGSSGSAGSGSAGSAVGPGSSAETGSSAERGSGSSSASAAKADRPATVTVEMVAVADRMIAALEALATSVEATKDCKSATAVVVAAQPAAEAIVTEAAKYDQSDKDPAARAWFETSYVPKMGAALQRITLTSERCKADKGWMGAITAYPLFPHKK